MRYFITFLALGVTLSSCIPSEAPDEQPAESAAPPSTQQPAPAPQAAVPQQQPAPNFEDATPEELIEEWETLAENPRENLGNPRVALIGVVLSSMGREHLQHFVDVLKDENADEAKKVLVAVTMQNVMSPEWVDSLRPLTAEEYDTTTRAVATQLLALTGEPELKPLFEELAKNDSSRIRLAAQQGLVYLGDTETSDKFFELYYDDDTTENEKNHIAQTLSRFPQEKYLPIYRDTLVDESAEFQTRVAVTAALGSVGKEEDIAALEKIQNETSSPDLKIVANMALEQLRSHIAKDEATDEEENPDQE